MNDILNWKAFAYKFEANPQAAFETLAYHMFCRKYHITEGLPAFYNQKHIETEPHRCEDGTMVGFQAKYYSTPSITAAQKNELIKAIEGAARTYSGLNLLYFYISCPFSQSSSKDKTKTEMQTEIEKEAESLGIKVKWVVPSNFEIILNDDEYSDLREFFFVVDERDALCIRKSLTDYVPADPETGLIGRDDIVQELRTMLDDKKCIALVSGLGGIGKTAVMKEVYDIIATDGNDKNLVAWINCGDSLEDDLLVLRDPLGVPKGFGREEAYADVINKLQGLA